MTHLFCSNENTKMAFRRIVSIFKPNFAEDGLNERLYQNKVYNIFVKQREAGGKYFNVVVVVIVDVFEANFPFLYSLKISGNLQFLNLLRGYRKRRLTRHGLSKEELNRQARALQLPFLFEKHINTRGVHVNYLQQDHLVI